MIMLWRAIVLALACPSCLWAQPGLIELDWTQLPPLPDPLGVAGPYVGVVDRAIIVAGGANFPEPVWENDKQWLSTVYLLKHQGDAYRWSRLGHLARPLAYGAAVTTPHGVICIGGNDSQDCYADCFLLRWGVEPEQLIQRSLPSLPQPRCYGQACCIGDYVYVVGGQTDLQLESATSALLRLDISSLTAAGLQADVEWERLPDVPTPARAFNMLATAQHGGTELLYLMGGRRQVGEETVFLDDCWEYNPATARWSRRADMPRANAGGTAIEVTAGHLVLLGGDDGKLFTRADMLGDRHPGFEPIAWSYDVGQDRWQALAAPPANQVTTLAVSFGGDIILASGETRPRVRTPTVWRISKR